MFKGVINNNMESTNQKDTKTYHEQKYVDNTLRLRSILKTLPAFARDYFRAVEPTTSARTRISYAYDIRVFFHFLMENNPLYKDYSIDQFTLQDLERLEPVDIEEYQEYLKVYENDDKKQITNTEKRACAQNVGVKELLWILLQTPGHLQKSDAARGYAETP